MRRLIAAINMTIDVFCDRTPENHGTGIHQHYTHPPKYRRRFVWKDNLSTGITTIFKLIS